MKIVTWHEPLYKEVFIILHGTEKDFTKWIDKECPTCKFDVKNVAGKAIRLDKIRGDGVVNFIWINSKSTKRKGFRAAVIAHEALHIVHLIMDRRSMEHISDSNIEAWCYLLEYLVNQIHTRLKI